MAIERNPDKKPKSESVKDQAARIAGLTRIQIVCDTPEDQPDDPDTEPINFIAYTDHLPRKGEIIILQDGKAVKVQNIYHRIATAGKAQLTVLLPCVYATLTQGKLKENK
jgi:hypothetical protein